MDGQRIKAQEDVRFLVLRLLQENPEMSKCDIAATVDVSVGGVHYCLNALVEKGPIKFGNFSASQDKWRHAYILTPKGLSETGGAHIAVSQAQDGRIRGAQR